MRWLSSAALKTAAVTGACARVTIQADSSWAAAPQRQSPGWRVQVLPLRESPPASPPPPVRKCAPQLGDSEISEHVAAPAAGTVSRAGSGSAVPGSISARGVIAAASAGGWGCGGGRVGGGGGGWRGGGYDVLYFWSSGVSAVLRFKQYGSVSASQMSATSRSRGAAVCCPTSRWFRCVAPSCLCISGILAVLSRRRLHRHRGSHAAASLRPPLRR